MSLALLRSRALTGLEAPLVSVEVHLANGLPAFNIVGLADTEVRESRERVRAAILNSQLEFPSRRITVNLAPADLPKESGYRLVAPMDSHGLVTVAWTFQQPSPLARPDHGFASRQHGWMSLALRDGNYTALRPAYHTRRFSSSDHPPIWTTGARGT